MLQAQLLATPLYNNKDLERLAQRLRLRSTEGIPPLSDLDFSAVGVSILTPTQIRAVVRQIAVALASVPQFGDLSEQLLGDIAYVEGRLPESCDHYLHAASHGMTLTIAIRGKRACLESGRAEPFLRAIHSLAMEVKTSTTAKLEEQMRAEANAVAPRSVILVEGDGSIPAEFNANWRKAGEILPVTFVHYTGREPYCDGIGIGFSDINIRLARLSSANTTPTSGCGVSVLETPYFLGLEALGIKKPEASLRQEDYFRAVARSIAADILRGEPAMSSGYGGDTELAHQVTTWRELLSEEFDVQVCGRALAESVPTQGSQAYNQAFCEHTLMARLDSGGFEVVRLTEARLNTEQFLPVRGVIPSVKSISDGTYPLILAKWAIVKENQVQVVSALASFRSFANSRWRFLDDKGDVVRWPLMAAKAATDSPKASPSPPTGVTVRPP